MNEIQCNFYSKHLRMDTSITVLIPSYFNERSNGKPLSQIYNSTIKFKTLFLLHGNEGDHTSWLRHTSIERYAQKKQLAVVMPSAYNSSYSNMAHGMDYFSYLSEELPLFVRAMLPLSEKREDNFVAGLSMGGRGAFLWAFRRPEFFAAAACLSGSLDINEMISRYSQENATATLKRFEDTYGDITKIKGSDNDVYALAKKLKESGAQLPKLYMACGTEDVRHETQFKPFIAYAKQIGLELYHEEGPGIHDFDFWDPYIARVINWLPL